MPRLKSSGLSFLILSTLFGTATASFLERQERWRSLGPKSGDRLDVIHEEASKLTKTDIAELLRKALAGDADCQVLLGEAYAFGYGVKQRYSEAIKWFRMSGEQGNAAALFSLCNLYQYGHGVRRDVAEAIKWCRYAGEQGLAAAQAKLGNLYRNHKNYSEAAEWTQRAAEQGNWIAQINLASAYANGEGVPQNTLSAYVWILIARSVRCGQPLKICVEFDAILNATTKSFQDGLAQKLSPEQIGQGKLRAAEWLRSHPK